MTRLLFPVLTLVFALGLAVLGGPSCSRSAEPQPAPHAGSEPIHEGKIP